MIWGCFSAISAGTLHIIRGNINGKICWDILEETLISLAQKPNLGRRQIFQQDNDPKHGAKITQEGFAWPCQFPHIGNLWRIVTL